MSTELTFKGFPQEGMQFLADLTANNNRDWFNAHKQDYKDYIVAPVQAFVSTMGQLLQKISPDVMYDTRTNGSGSMMRIYRDTRFSKDKTPYKTGVGIIFWEGAGKKSEAPGFYFGLDATGAGAHAGLHGFDKPFLTAYRQAVLDDALGAELETILATLRSKQYRYSEPQYKQVPRGYDKEHPRANLLLYNGLYASSPFIPPHVAATPELIDICFGYYEKMAPLQQWLVKVYKRTAG